jgi:FkbM family methyltransferase
MQTNISEEILGFKFKYFINDCLASNSVGIKKEWEPHITKFTRLYNSLFNIKNIIDVGANIGYHTLLFSQVCSENVYAFEPQIQSFKLLEDNLEINKIKNVILYNYACGDENCDIKMPVFINCNNTLNMGDITPNMNINGDFSMSKSIILDEYNFSSKIDLIKLDVQGWEKKVLMGATTLLEIHKPILIVEFEYFQLEKTNTTCKELFDFIRNQNYYIFYLEYIYQSDHVCVHKDNLAEFRLKFENNILPHTEDNHLNNNLIYGVNEKIVM